MAVRLDYKENRVPENQCFWIVVLEKTTEYLGMWRSNQSIIKEISPECSFKGLMLKLKLQYFGHLMRRADHLKRPWCWERLKVGGTGEDRGWDGWVASPTWWVWVWVNSGSCWLTGRLVCCSPWGCKELDRTERLNWTEIIVFLSSLC